MWRPMPYLFRSATENNSSFARNLGVMETDDRAASILYVGTHYVCSLVPGTSEEPVWKMLCSDKSVASVRNKTAIRRQTSNI